MNMLSKDRQARVIELHKMGLRVTDISREIGITNNTTHRILHKAGLKNSVTQENIAKVSGYVHLGLSLDVWLKSIKQRYRLD
jgi:hypothetical protein